MTLLDRVKLLCSENKLTLATLEKTLKLGNGTLSRWDNSSPSGDKLTKVADHFNVTTDYLLGRTDIRKPNSTTAAHKDDGDKWSDEELKKIEEYKELLLLARQAKK